MILNALIPVVSSLGPTVSKYASLFLLFSFSLSPSHSDLTPLSRHLDLLCSLISQCVTPGSCDFPLFLESSLSLWGVRIEYFHSHLTLFLDCDGWFSSHNRVLWRIFLVWRCQSCRSSLNSSIWSSLLMVSTDTFISPEYFLMFSFFKLIFCCF